MTREIKLDFDDTGALDLNPENLFRGAEARGMSLRTFLKLGALSFAAAACAKLPEAFTPTPKIEPTRQATQTPAETKIAPTQAEAGSFNSVSVLSETDILNDEKIGLQAKILRDSLVASLQSKPENSVYDKYTLWGISPETPEKSLFLFITAQDTEEGKAAVFMVLPDGTGLAWARLLKPLETTNSKGDRILELLLTKDRVTGEELKNPLVIFTFSLSSEADTIFTPFGDGSEFQNQTAPIPKVILANYIEATATPEPAEIQEYVPGGIIFEETISGVDLEISPEADQEGIYNTIVASFVRFLNKDQNKGAWQEVLKDHPEWGHITNSEAEEIRTEAMTAFLKNTGGRIYINFFGGTGYVREGWIDLNKGIKLGVEEEKTGTIPSDHARLLILPQDISPQGVMTTAAGGKIYSENERLIFDIIYSKVYIDDDKRRNSGKFGFNYVVSYSFSLLVEAQADQGFANPSIPSLTVLGQSLTTRPTMFLWGSGNEDWVYLSGIDNCFLREIEK